MKWPPGAPEHPALKEASDAFARGEDARAIELVGPLARAGDIPAIHALGSYLFAKGDLGEAERCLRRAAEDDYPPAVHNLGVFLLDGSRNDEARVWLQRSVDLGYEGSIASDRYWWRGGP